MESLETYWWVWAIVIIITALFLQYESSADMLMTGAMNPRSRWMLLFKIARRAMYAACALLTLAIIAHLFGGTGT